jgi:uncharacterized membrane protein
MRPLFLLPYGLAALAVAVVVHLTSLLLMPWLAPADAFQRLSEGAEANRIEILSPARPLAMPVPFADPAVQVAVCRVDVSAAPTLIRIRTGESFVSLLLLAPGGKVLYSLTDKAAIRGSIDIRLATRQQLDLLEAGEAEGEPVRELRLVLSGTTALLVLRAFTPWPSLFGRVEDVLASARCDSAREPG